ncbi:MAG TPA: FAD-dependent oxidoreductase, partial [Corynebacterium sp.]|nr:FAD-dependent oxidoreductase [Corynebacterium sp.]
MASPLRIAVVGAGPAGIYASDLLVKSGLDIRVDLIEKMPAPFGLIRYGVAPDHPRIKGIVNSLHRVLEQEEIRFLGNIEVGTDITVEELREFYDAVVFSTGATDDRDFNIPGHDLDGSHGAGEFVGFYDGNPDFSRDWDLNAEKVAVIGVGNVALDIARILAKTADELLVTEIPDNVYDNLARSAVKEVHVFGRRGP